MKTKSLVVTTLIVLLVGMQQLASAQNFAPYPGAVPQPGASALTPYSGYPPMMAAAPIVGSPIAAAAFAGGGAKGVNTCGGGKDGCKGCSNCGWDHCWAVFGEFLYLRPRDSEIAYGVPINGPVVPNPAGIQVGRIGVVDQDFEPGFRFGVTRVRDPYRSVTVSFSMLESTRSDNIATTPGNYLFSLVAHPGSRSAGQGWLSANAVHGIDFETGDLESRTILSCSDNHRFTSLIGTRYGGLEQNFRSDFRLAPGQEVLTTDIDFTGIGPKFGIEAEVFDDCRRIAGFVKLHASFLAGEFDAAYTQTRTITDPVVVDTSWEAGRVVPVVDLELGTSWTSKSGSWHLSTGYLVSAWFNTLNTDEWIQSVGQNSFVGMSDAMTLEGLTFRLEGRF